MSIETFVTKAEALDQYVREHRTVEHCITASLLTLCLFGLVESGTIPTDWVSAAHAKTVELTLQAAHNVSNLLR